MEEKFLLYLLYIALIDIRARSYEHNDRKTFWLCDLLHKVPIQLAADEGTGKAYAEFCENVKSLGIEQWLETRKEEFYDRYPEYKE